MTSANKTVGSIALYPKALYCAVSTLVAGHFDGALDYEVMLPTNSLGLFTPLEGLERAVSFFKSRKHKLSGLGVSMYGVIDRSHTFFQGLQPSGWDISLNVKDEITRRTDLIEANRIYCLNDSTAAAIAEFLFGAAIDIHDFKNDHKNFVYFKILDGIGSGILIEGKVREAEMGHLLLRREQSDRFPGRCFKHTDCIEGLASYAALLDRIALEEGHLDFAELEKNETHDIWYVEAHYLAELTVAALLTYDARRIVFEGDVFDRSDGTRNHLLNLIREKIPSLLNDYPAFESFIKDLPGNVVLSHLKGEYASLIGALEVGRKKALHNSDEFELVVDVETGDGFRMSIRDLAHSSNSPPLARSYAIVPRQRQRKKVFGLSISETVEWASAIAEDGRLKSDIQSGVLCEIPKGLLPFNPREPIYLQDELSKGLLALRAKSKSLFENVEGVGVSTIGIVSRDELQLVNIARKNWVAGDGKSPIVDFKKLFFPQEGQLFNGLTRSQIAVQNDAPARCLTEYLYGFDSNRPKSLLHLLVDEGVNGASLYEGDLPHMLRHPELGHCMPSLHPDDLDFAREHSGCPRHWRCFEGIASTARVRLQWGHELWELPENHVAWDRLAFYLSQLAMTGVLMGDVERVSFGGAAFRGPKGLMLLRKIQKEFIILNAAYLPHYESRDAVESLIQRASFGDPVKPLSALTIACAAAFKDATPVGSLTAKEQGLMISRSSGGGN